MPRDFENSALGCETIPDIIRKNKDLHANRIAFRDERGARTFDAFYERVTSLQSALEQQGVTKGDRIALLSRNCIEYMEVCGASGRGAIVATLNWRLSYAEIERLMADCQPKVIIAEEFLLNQEHWPSDPFENVDIKVTLAGNRNGWADYEQLVAKGAGRGANSKASVVSPDDPACIVYTSGTSGLPKGAIHCHGGIAGNAREMADTLLGLTPDDVTLAMMPFFHVGGMWYHAFPSFAAGSETIIRSRFRPQDALELITQYKVSNTHLVPTMVADLITHDVDSAANYLKTLFYAASPMPLPILRSTMEKFPDCAFVQSYGSTEAGTVSFLSNEDHKLAVNSSSMEGILKSCGRPFSGVEIQLRNEAGGEVEVEGIGEVHVRSSNTMTQYWNNPTATEEILSDGWVASGDLGRIDEHGYLYLVDRKNDMIITGGENVYPGEVEQVLYEIENVAEAAIIGVSDPRFVEKVVACIVVKPGTTVTEGDILAFCKERLAGYKCPKQVVFYDSLPRSGAGKILKRPLRDAINKEA